MTTPETHPAAKLFPLLEGLCVALAALGVLAIVLLSTPASRG